MSGVNLPGESSELSLQMRVDDDDENDDYNDDDNDGDDEDLEDEKKKDMKSRRNSAGSGGNDPLSQYQSQYLSVDAMREAQVGGRREAKDRKKLKGNTQKELRRLQKEMLDNSISTFPGGQVRPHSCHTNHK